MGDTVVGALTLKSFPFELRGWDIEQFESIDPTDGFGSNTRVYISNAQVVQVEPNYNSNTFNTWLTDKGRQYFDGIFGVWRKKKKININFSKNSWESAINMLLLTIYVFDHCSSLKSNKYLFTIVFEQASLEAICLLITLSKSYSFIKLRRSDSFIRNNDLEVDLQLNKSIDKVKIHSSTLCLLIATNPRYEGFMLNLNLRQRFLKGNFECLAVGSSLDLTFPVTLLGSSLNNLESIIEGNNAVCQEIYFSKNAQVISNKNLSKRNDSKNLTELLKGFKRIYTLKTGRCSLEILNPSLMCTGSQIISNIPLLSSNDLYDFSSLYLLNVPENLNKRLKKVLKLKLLNFLSKSQSTFLVPLNNKLLIEHSSVFRQNIEIFNKINLLEGGKSTKYVHLPTSTFYENDETFISTEGFIKRANKLISRKNAKNNWQILRRIMKKFRTSLKFVNNHKDNLLLVHNFRKIIDFKNYMNFHFIATSSLNNLNFFLNIKDTPFELGNNNSIFKNSVVKLVNTKLNYWLDDFFIGGKDEYSKNSLILANCSKTLRTNATNFF